MVVYSKLLFLFHSFKSDDIWLMVKLHCVAAQQGSLLCCSEPGLSNLMHTFHFPMLPEKYQLSRGRNRDFSAYLKT